MSIITVSREFGSGGRELGKRLAEYLKIAYYDREIISGIAEKSALDAAYIERIIEAGVQRHYPISFNRSFALMPTLINTGPNLLAEQHKVLRELAARGDCVIVGRAADAILSDYKPFKLFVYANMEAKIERCRQRAAEDEALSEKELERKIKQIDRARARSHDIVSDFTWGERFAYDLCINTSHVDIPSVIPSLAAYITCCLEKR